MYANQSCSYLQACILNAENDGGADKALVIRKPDEMNVFKGVTKNRLFLGIVGLTVAFQVVIIMFLGKFISILRLSWQLWLVSIGIGFISWPLAAIGKLIPVSPSMDCLPISSHPVGRGV